MSDQSDKSDKSDAKLLSKRLERGLPQTVPFQFYARSVYSFGRMDSESEGPEGAKKDPEDPWWEAEVEGHDVGAPRKPGHVSLPDAVRAAWGMRWWGERLKQEEWVEHADQLLNLALAAQLKDGFRSSGCNLTPFAWEDEREPDADLPYWFVRWLEKWPDHSRRLAIMERLDEEIERCESLQLEAESRPIRFFNDRGEGHRLGPTGSAFVGRLVRSNGVTAELRTRAEKLQGRLHGGFGLITSISVPTAISLATLEDFQNGRATLTELLGRAGTGVWFDSPDTTRFDESGWLDSFGDPQNTEMPLFLMRVGAIGHKKETFQRGVASLKANLNLLQDPTLRANGIVLPDSIPIGSMATHFDGEQYQVSNRHTFEKYEGQLLTSFAEALDEFGGFYIDPTGWAVGIDGCYAGKNNVPVSNLSSNPVPYRGEHKVEIVEPGKPRRTVEVTILPSICKIVAEQTSDGPVLIAVPGVVPPTKTAPKSSGTFTLAGMKWKGVAKIGLRGLVCPWPKDVVAGTFSFKGKIGDTDVSFGPVVLNKPTTDHR